MDFGELLFQAPMIHVDANRLQPFSADTSTELFCNQLQLFLTEKNVHEDSSQVSVFYLMLGFLSNIFSSHSTVKNFRLTGGYIAINSDFVTLFVIQNASSNTNNNYKFRVFDLYFRSNPSIGIKPMPNFFQLRDKLSEDLNIHIKLSDLESAFMTAKFIQIVKKSPIGKFQVSGLIRINHKTSNNMGKPCKFHKISIEGKEKTAGDFATLIPTFIFDDFFGNINRPIPTFIEQQMNFVQRNSIFRTILIKFGTSEFLRFVQGASMNFVEKFQLDMSVGLLIDGNADRLTISSNRKLQNGQKPEPFVFIIPKNLLIECTDDLVDSYVLQRYVTSNSDFMIVSVWTMLKVFDFKTQKTTLSFKNLKTSFRPIVTASRSMVSCLSTVANNWTYKLSALQCIFDQIYVAMMDIHLEQLEAFSFYIIGQIMSRSSQEGREEIRYYLLKPKVSIETYTVVIKSGSKAILINGFYTNLLQNVKNDKIILPDNLDSSLDITRIVMMVNFRDNNIELPEIDNNLDGLWTTYHFQKRGLTFKIDICEHFMKVSDLTTMYKFETIAGSFLEIPKAFEPTSNKWSSTDQAISEFLKQSKLFVRMNQTSIAVLYQGLYSTTYNTRIIEIQSRQCLFLKNPTRKLFIFPMEHLYENEKGLAKVNHKFKKYMDKFYISQKVMSAVTSLFSNRRRNETERYQCTLNDD